MKKGKLYSGIIIILISLFFFFNTLNFRKLEGQIVGADFMPRMYALLLIFLSIVLIVQYFREKGSEEYREEAEEGYSKYAFITMLMLLVYIIAINMIGFYFSTLIFTFVVLLFTQNKSKKVLFIIPPSITIAIYIFFKLLLKVSLPSGILF